MRTVQKPDFTWLSLFFSLKQSVNNMYSGIARSQSEPIDEHQVLHPGNSVASSAPEQLERVELGSTPSSPFCKG